MVKKNSSLLIKTAVLWLFLCLATGVPIVISAPNADVDLGITKTGSVNPVVAGEALTYRLSLTNTGPSTATGVAITDTLPGGVTFTSASTGCEFNAGLRIVRCGMGEVGAGAVTSATIQVRVDPANTGSLLNQAIVTTLDTDTNGTNNSAQASTTITSSSDVHLSMSAPPSVIAGDVITYSLGITNTGPSDARGVTVRDDFPGGTSFVRSSIPCSPQGHRLTCSAGSLATNTHTNLTITLLVDPGKIGTVNNDATVSATTSDPNLTNNNVTLSTPVVISSDITISKSGAPDPITPGAQLTYTIRTHNNGLSNGQGVTFSDTLPSQVAFQSYTATKGTCTGTTTLTCTAGSALPGETITVTLVGLVNISASPGVITNTVSAQSTSPDPNLSNNSASDRTIITAVNDTADLHLSKHDMRDPVGAGDTLTYTITVSNTGPANATGVIVTDTLPVGAALASISTSQGTCIGAICTLGTINVTNQALITMTANVLPTVSGVITNTARVSANESDPALSNNTAYERTTILPGPADLQVVKHDLSDPVRAGEVLTYTITVRNTGPGNATGVVVTDTLPVSAALASISASQGTCIGIICTLGSINVSSQALITMSVNVYPTITGVITNTARVSGNENDPVLSNNTAHERTTILPGPADLQVTKHDMRDPIRAGGTLTYTVTASNTGPANATGVIVTDTLPVGTALASISTSQGICIGAICTLGTINVTNRALITVTANVLPTVSGVITNTARVSANESDPVLSNNTAFERTTILPGPADIQVTKHDLSDPVRAGEVLTYTITVSNTGPAAGSAVVITDTLPVSVTLRSATPSQGSCVQARCELGPILDTSRATVTMTVYVNPSATGVITNSVSVSSNQVDPVIGNNNAHERTTIIQAADLSLEKTGTPEPVFAGRNLVYRLRIMNHGPSSAAGIHLVDDLPTAVRFVSAPAYCIHSNGSVECSLSRMLPGASTEVTITVNANLLATGLVTNTASLSSNTTDPVPANNQSEWTTRILAPDNENPTVSWMQPVLNGQRINVGCQMLHLQVNATDNVAVQSVRFYRWDTTVGPGGGWVDIGVDTSLPYEWDINTCSLAANWNQVFAQSQDTYGNLSIRQFIWIYRYMTFLPVIRR